MLHVHSWLIIQKTHELPVFHSSFTIMDIHTDTLIVEVEVECTAYPCTLVEDIRHDTFPLQREREREREQK
jgi:hypothetical protein